MIALLILVVGRNCLGQRLVRSAHIIDNVTKTSLPYVNIIIKDKLTGTFSDENGFFSIEGNQRDSLLISHVGYSKIITPITDTFETIELKPLPNKLNDITITSSRRLQRELLGFEDRRVHIFMAGVFQYAVFIANKQGSVGYIKKMYLRFDHSLHRTKEDKMPYKVRIRVYEINPLDGKPGSDILRNERIITIKPNQEHVEVDFSRESIVFPIEGFFIGIDLLGYVDNSGRLVNYHIKDAKKHLHVPITTKFQAPLTYTNPIGQRWDILKTLDTKTGRMVIANACFGVEVEF